MGEGESLSESLVPIINNHGLNHGSETRGVYATTSTKGDMAHDTYEKYRCLKRPTKGYPVEMIKIHSKNEHQ